MANKRKKLTQNSKNQKNFLNNYRPQENAHNLSKAHRKARIRRKLFSVF